MEDNHQGRDEVLIAFHEECDIPTRADVERWTQAHPDFAQDIREHAAIRLAMVADLVEHPAQMDDNMVARGRSRVQAAMFEAEAGDLAAPSGPTLTAMLKSAGLTLPDLARGSLACLWRHSTSPMPTPLASRRWEAGPSPLGSRW
jgi:hypothetical protein